MSFSRSDVSAKKHMARVSDLYRERVRSIKTVLFFIVSVSLLSGEAVPTPLLLPVLSFKPLICNTVDFFIREKYPEKQRTNNFVVVLTLTVLTC